MKSIIKRDGTRQKFNKNKIIDAVLAAFKEVDGDVTDYALEKSGNIADYIADVAEERELSIEEIQDYVEKGLMATRRKDVARAYILYREKRTQARKNPLDTPALELISGTNEELNYENSNKRSELVTTQRDYLAGILSKHIAKKYIFPHDAIEAHEEGIIHIHDMDYMAQNTLSNCFRGDTKFISIDGVRPFCSFKDGEETFVPTHTGEWKKAKVRKYGIQKLNRITLKRGPWTERAIYVTSNHTWLLKNGDRTDHLQIGNYLISTPNIASFDWEDLSVEEKQLWCKGFAYGDGATNHFVTSDYTSIRLCGKKNKYIPYFKEAGYKVTFPPCQEGDASVKIPQFDKNYLPNLKTPEECKIFCYGYLCADGHHADVSGGSTKNEFRGVQVTGEKKCEEIYNLLNKSGYYVSSSVDLTNQITNYGARTDTTFAFRFQANQSYRNWKVIDIERDVQECEVWCLEVEDNHSFILEGGIVTGNCCLINLNDMLQNGTVINGVSIEKPHRIITAMTIATQIVSAVASSQYGGCTFSLGHLAPFVRSSRDIYYLKYLKRGLTEEQASTFAEQDIRKEVEDAVQTMNYQLNSFTTTNGQSPFVSVSMSLSEAPGYQEEIAMLSAEIFKQRIAGLKNEVGVPVTQAFPKLIYCLDEYTKDETCPYWWLTELAAKCTAKRMVPDYTSKEIMTANKGGYWPSMGCRSSLSADHFTEKYGNLARAKDYTGESKYYGRFNVGVTTINLPYIALLAKEENKNFYEILDKYLELCHKVQKIRADRLSKTKAKVAPILWCHGAFARLDPEDTLEELVHHGYATSSLGYVGLFETTKVMTGKSHTTEEGKKFAKEVLQYLDDKCDEWASEEDIGYSVYSTPEESTTFKFAKALRNRFGIIKDITDKDYVMNSYHVDVKEHIDPFSKLSIEAEFQKLSPGGYISYIESADMQNNIPAVLEIIKFIGKNIGYAEINTKSDYCQVCGYDGEILIETEENNHHYYRCPNCGNTNTDKMNIARRVCGYISTTVPNQGRMDEFVNRYVHLTDHEEEEL